MSLRLVGQESEQVIQQILESAPQYSLHVDGALPDKEGAENVLTALPPRCVASQKAVFIVEWNGTAVGVVDLLDGYPEAGIAFIGLMLFSEGFQGRGLGRSTFAWIENHCRKDLGSREIQISVVDSNPVREFWTKLGFTARDRVREHRGKNVTSVVRTMGKVLV